MKKLISLIAVALLLCVAACQNKGYKVTGTATGAQDGDTVIMASIRSMFEIDTLQTVIVKGGKFVFEGMQDTAAMRYVIWRSNANPDLSIATQIALENANITVELDTAENTVAVVRGTTANDALTALNQKEMIINQQAQHLITILNDPSISDDERSLAEVQFNNLQEELVGLYKDLVKENITNIVGVTYLAQYGSLFEDSEVMEFLNSVPHELADESIQDLQEVYAIKAKTAIGQAYKDFKASTPEGGELSISDLAANAKVLMIDFWASWCGPCRNEMPNVKAAYDQFHSQGFEIIGVSLDQNESDWKDAIAELGMSWPQISDLKGWECEGASIYGIRAIPATVLIKDGVVVARDLRDKELIDKIAELLN